MRQSMASEATDGKPPARNAGSGRKHLVPRPACPSGVGETRSVPPKVTRRPERRRCDAACATQAALAEIEPNDTVAGADAQAAAGVLFNGRARS